MEGEFWEELEDRALRWLNGEEVPGPWGNVCRKKDPRTRAATLFSWERLVSGETPITKTVSIGDTHPNGVQYIEEPASARLAGLIDERIEEVLDRFAE